MYRPPFQLPPQLGTDLFPKEMQAPPVARIIVVAQGDRWDSAALKAVVEEAKLTIRNNTANIIAFFNAQRQNVQVSGLPQYRKTKVWDDLQLDYTNNQGTETISLYIKPRTERGGMKDTGFDLKIPNSPVLDVETTFRYWPIPGSMTLGNPPEGWRRTDYVAWYDPFYKHDSIENPLTAFEGDVSFAALEDLRRNVFYSYFSWGEDQQDYTPQNRQGFDEILLLGVGGEGPVGKTGIWPVLCDGKQYFEAEIVALPEGVPDSYVYGTAGPRYNNINDNPLQRNVDGRVEVKWPTELNTFFNPVIGLAPKYFKDLSFDAATSMSTSMLGLDPRLSEPRSIGAVRTSNMRGDVYVQIFHYGGIYVDITTASGYYASPGRYYVCDLNPVDDRVSGEDMPANFVRSLGSRHTRDGVVFEVRQVNNGGVSRSAGGPIDGNEINTHNNPISGLSDYVNGSWFGWHSTGMVVDYVFQSRGVVGGPYHDVSSFPYYPGESDPTMWPEIPGSTLVRVEHYNTSQTFPNVLYGDFCVYDDDLGDKRVMVPLDQEGTHCPVLKGRGDFLAYYRNQPLPTEEPSYIVGGTPGDLSMDWQADNGTGIDTGTNLPALAVGDRVMVATDTESRKVWFGKNGVWYGPDGEVTHEQIQRGEGYTTLMDVVEGEGPEYYPAVTVKYGTTHVRLHLGGSCVYPPPPEYSLFAADSGSTVRIDTGKMPD